MCTKEHWQQCNTSDAYRAAIKFALELEEYAKKLGHNGKTIRIRNKEQIIKGGFGKSDAQVIWEDGPEDWTLELMPNTEHSVSTVSERNDTVSFFIS